MKKSKVIIAIAIIFVVLKLGYNIYQEYRPAYRWTELASFVSESKDTNIDIHTSGYNSFRQCEIISISGMFSMNVHTDKPLTKENFSVQWNEQNVTLTVSGNKQKSVVLELNTEDADISKKNSNENEKNKKYGYKGFKKIINQSSSDDGFKKVCIHLDTWHGLNEEIDIIYENEEIGETVVIDTLIANDHAELGSEHCQIQWEGDVAVLILNGKEQSEYIWRISFAEK